MFKPEEITIDNLNDNAKDQLELAESISLNPIKYDKNMLEKLRNVIFTPIKEDANDKQKQETYSYLSNDMNTIPLMNLSELYLKSQDFSK